MGRGSIPHLNNFALPPIKDDNLERAVFTLLKLYERRELSRDSIPLPLLRSKSVILYITDKVNE